MNDLEIPRAWIWVYFKDIIINKDGERVPLNSEDRKRRKKIYPYYGATGIIDYVDDYLFDGNFLLIGEDGANLYSKSKPLAFQAKGKFWVNNHAHIIQTKYGIPLSYVEYFINSINLAHYITGTAQPKLTQVNMNKIPIPIAPLEEQKRIVSKLEELFSKLDAGIEYLKKTQILLKQYRQSVLKYAFEGKLTEKWRKKNPSRGYFENKHLDEVARKYSGGEDLSNNRSLPANWISIRLDDVYDVTMGQSPPGNSYNTKGIGLPLLNGPSEFGTEYPIPRQWTNRITKTTEISDLLICVRGNTTGRMNWTDRKYCIGRGLASIRPKFNEISIKLLFYFLERKVKEIMSNTSGSTFPNLSKDKLSGFLFPLIPTEEQRLIVNELERQISLIENTKKIIINNLVFSQKLRNSILHYVFQGKLVPQDSTEEPASLLLEKIKQEKSNHSKTKPKLDSHQTKLI